MPGQHKISITVSDEEFEALSAAVAEGDYASTTDALRDAVGEWRINRELNKPHVIAKLRQLVEEGLASGSAGPVDFDALRAEARAKLQIRRQLGANGH